MKVSSIGILLGAFSARLGETSAPNSKDRSSICTRCFYWVGKLWPRQRQQPALGHTASPNPLSQAASISFGDLASGRRSVLFLPAKFSSADPDFNIRPPTPCPALAATLDFPQTDIPMWPVCSCPEPQGVRDTWDHTEE